MLVPQYLATDLFAVFPGEHVKLLQREKTCHTNNSSLLCFHQIWVCRQVFFQVWKQFLLQVWEEQFQVKCQVLLGYLHCHMFSSRKSHKSKATIASNLLLIQPLVASYQRHSLQLLQRRLVMSLSRFTFSSSTFRTVVNLGTVKRLCWLELVLMIFSSCSSLLIKISTRSGFT